MTSYTGRGFEQIVNYIDSHGCNSSISGRIVRISGEKVADVEFVIQNDNLILFVNGHPFQSITAALISLEGIAATHESSGSLGTGNTANNVIGNYAIFRHVVFGGVSLEQIIGRSTSSRVRITKSTNVTHSVRGARMLNLVARDGIFKKYSFKVIQAIAKTLGMDTKYMSKLLDTLTVNEFELMFGNSSNNFDLNVYSQEVK